MKQNNQAVSTASIPHVAPTASVPTAAPAASVLSIDSMPPITAMNPSSYSEAKGKIRYKMTNDYMFKVIFQHTEILKGLLCALLGLEDGQIASITVNNPLIVGQTIVDKVFILDINISLNEDTDVNIELQVDDMGDWNDRSLSYLCRSFDHLYRGEEYSSVRSVIHIGILDFNIFDETPEFYSSYKLMNVKNHKIYNDKFNLRVLQLKRRELATEEDRAHGLDRWASLFKATTWEEIKMLAQKNTSFDMAARELYKSNADERIRRECEAREEYEFQMRRRQRIMDDLQAKVKEAEEKYANLENKNASLENRNASLEDKNSSLENRNASLENKNASLENRNASLENRNVSLENKNASLENRNASLENKNASLENKNASLENKNAEIARENERLRLENERLRGMMK